MKILMIGPFPGGINGMTIANNMLRNGLKNKGHKVESINTNTETKLSNLKSQGKFNIKKIFLSIKPIVNGCKKIRKRKFDVVYITPAQSYIGFLKYIPFISMASLNGIKCYIHFHGGFVRKMYDSQNNINKRILNRYFNKCNGIIVLGNSLKKMFDNIVDENKIFVCENGVENEFIINNIEKLSNKINRINNNKRAEIVYLSNLIKSKGILDLLKACLILKERKFNFHLNIAGSIEPNIEKEIKELLIELGGCVTYNGIVTGAKKRELLENSSIFCLPTYYKNEGQPISILEAMGMGCAIVTTYQGGIKDIFKHLENGELCYSKNVNSIVNAIIKCHENYEFYAINNFEKCINEYTEEAYISRIQGILREEISKI